MVSSKRMTEAATCVAVSDSEL